MTLSSALRRAATRLGLVSRPAPRPAIAGNSTRAGLARAAGRGTPVSTVIDVGASDGRWSTMAATVFPAARFLLVEAQPSHAAALRELTSRDRRFTTALVAAGPRDGTIHFDASDPFGGVASERSTGTSDLLVPMRTLDSLVAEHGLAGPFLVKLDTHGFETAILSGAAATLCRASLLVIEVYNFKLVPDDPGCLRFHELCGWLEARGFRCVDICEVSRRAGDQVLWQMDMLFEPASRVSAPPEPPGADSAGTSQT